MPWFLPVLAAGATMAFARKIVARYWHAQHAQAAAADPPGLRTVVRFAPGPDRRAEDVLLAIAAELARDLEGPLEITEDAIRARPGRAADPVDVVRVRHAAALLTAELTRAWTGVFLGDHTRRVLQRIDDALRASGATEILWFARHDRGFVDAYAQPFDAVAITDAR